MAYNQMTHSSFGTLLSDWRKKRRFSQLSFGLFAEVSPRHISFLETGRAKPSRNMVLKLAHCLNMPKADTNRALLLAGFAPAYHARAADDVDLAPIQQAITMLLENHMPYPAIGLDSLWNIKMCNAAAVKFLTDANLVGHTNMIEALIAQTPEQSAIENWNEAMALLLTHLQTELSTRGFDPQLQELAQKLSAHHDRYGEKTNIDKCQAVIPTRIKIGGQTISLFSTIVNFSTVQDITLHDLKIELMFPMDEASKAYFL